MTSYLAAVAAVMPASGWLGGRAAGKRVLLWALALFTTASPAGSAGSIGTPAPVTLMSTLGLTDATWAMPVLMCVTGMLFQAVAQPSRPVWPAPFLSPALAGRSELVLARLAGQAGASPDPVCPARSFRLTCHIR